MCEIVNCSVIDVDTCSPIYEPGPNTSELFLEEGLGLDTLYDEEGCFYTDILRETNSYKAYMTFSLWMGILTIGTNYAKCVVLGKSKTFLYPSFWMFWTHRKCCQHCCSL